MVVRMNRPAIRKAARVAKTVYSAAKKEPTLRKMMGDTQKKFLRELPTLASVTHEAIKLSKKVPVDSSTGTSLNIQKSELIETKAVKGTSESYSMYAYRRPRKLSAGAVKVQAISTVLDANVTAADNKRGYQDYMWLAAEPAINDDPTNNSFYKFTLREFFDKLPRLKYSVDGISESVLTNEESQMIHLGTLTNQMTINTPTGCVVDIYDLVPRFDIGGATRVNSFTGTGYGSPSWCVQQGNNSTEYINLSGDSMEASDSVQFNPDTSQTFNRVWKVIKKTRLMTTDGAIHRHNSVFGLNKTITYQKMAQASTSGQLFGGVCPAQMVVVTGYPNNTKYAVGMTNVSIRNDFKLDYHVIPDQGGKYFFQGKNAIS